MVTQQTNPPMTIQPISQSPLKEPHAESEGIQLEVRNLSAQAGKHNLAINDLSFQIQPGELVAVIAPEGAGSADLLRILAGLILPGKGQILYDGVSLQPYLKIFRSYIGYVPAENILYDQLTVKENLRYTAALRMPQGTSSQVRTQRVQGAMAQLGLQQLENNRLEGQRKETKRLANIAAEILNRPGVLFIEQLAERMDPAAEMRVTAFLLNLSRQGTTILFETQSSRCALLADKVILLAPDGSQAWFGPPSEALAYFQEFTADGEAGKPTYGFEDILALLQQSSTDNNEGWFKRFKASPLYSKYVDAPLNDEHPDLMLQDRPLSRLRKTASEKLPPPPIRQSSAVSKAAVFIGRGTRLLARSRAGLMMLLAPLILAPIDFLLSTPDMFDPLEGDPIRIPVSLGLLVFFNLLLSALLFQRETLKEKDIRRHEYRYLKGTLSYIFSKLWFVFFLALYQGAVWTAIHSAAAGFHFSVAQMVSFFITLTLVAGIGGLIGLSASTLATRGYAAVGIVLLLTLLQLIFSGSVIPIPHLARPAQFISLANPARYGFESLLTISRYGRDILADACWQLPEKERVTLSETQKQNCQCTGENLFSSCNFPGIHKFFTVAIEQPRPIAPTPDASLSQFPTQPLLRQGQTTEDFSKEVNNYTAQLETFQGGVDAYVKSLRQYAVDLANWQRVRATLIGNAEGVIGETLDHYGQGLQVNLPDHWLRMLELCFGFVVLFGGIQKGKDVSQW